MARKKKIAGTPARPKQRKFGSPIEIMLRNGIVESVPSTMTIFDHSVFAGTVELEFDAYGPGTTSIEGDVPWEEWGSGVDESWSLYGGVRILSYKVDFLLQMTDGHMAIECDGHEFHDRTKQQAAYDRARDRELLALGIPTIRFTGSEIHYHLEKCVADLMVAARAHEKACGAHMRGYCWGFDKGRKQGLEEAICDIAAWALPLTAEEHW